MVGNKDLHEQNIIACIWDFDKTLIHGYMQGPIFRYFGVDEERFWREVNALPALYAKRGIKVSPDTVYLNHFLTYVKQGPFKGLNNALLHELGKELKFAPGLPELFVLLKNLVRSRDEYRRNDIGLEHYIISTGLAEMIRGSMIAPHVDGIFGCEFIEDPVLPGYLDQEEFPMEAKGDISQIGVMVDNTIKTRFIFEINKGSNKTPDIDVNAKIRESDRRVPFRNMIYVADGPSDVPVFSVVRKNGGRTYAVYQPDNEKEFAQNDLLLSTGRIHAYGPSDYRSNSSTFMWLRMHVLQLCDEIVMTRERNVQRQVGMPPRHLHDGEKKPEKKDPEQRDLI